MQDEAGFVFCIMGEFLPDLLLNSLIWVREVWAAVVHVAAYVMKKVRVKVTLSAQD